LNSEATLGRILLIGECMVEFSPKRDGDFKLGFAGDTFNTAWYLRQLLPENWTVQYFTNIGDHRLSSDMLSFMNQSRIDTTHVKVMERMNAGLYVISLHNGERSFSYWRNISAARTLADDAARLASATRDADCVFFSGITLAILSEGAREAFLNHMAGLRSKGVLLVFDPNIRKRLWTSDKEIRHWINRAYAVAEVALPSFADESEMFGDTDSVGLAKRIKEAGAEEVIVKNGGDACYFLTGIASGSVLPRMSLTMVDSTGAGDSFNAGYIASKLLGDSTSVSVQKANDLAAKVIAGYGALVAV
jgi:2-dehydro-3-deoxygluconokinase